MQFKMCTASADEIFRKSQVLGYFLVPHRIITELSDEQEAALPAYRDKWRSIALSIEQIDREKIAAAVKATYADANT
jgi:hypothetical protein